MKINWKFAGKLLLEMILHFIRYAFIGFALTTGIVIADLIGKYLGV